MELKKITGGKNHSKTLITAIIAMVGLTVRKLLLHSKLNFGEENFMKLFNRIVNYSPLIEVGASWSIYPMVQVYPS